MTPEPTDRHSPNKPGKGFNALALAEKNRAKDAEDRRDYDDQVAAGELNSSPENGEQTTTTRSGKHTDQRARPGYHALPSAKLPSVFSPGSAIDIGEAFRRIRNIFEQTMSAPAVTTATTVAAAAPAVAAAPASFRQAAQGLPSEQAPAPQRAQPQNTGTQSAAAPEPTPSP